MMTNKIQRNPTIDRMRFIGIVCIIANHARFSDTLNTVISFDVVLLMFLAGMSYCLSRKVHSIQDYGSYILRRVQKLLFPVWMFLIGFFVVSLMLFHVSYSISVIAKSFLLLAGGILFVWIYRVYFTTALLNPVSDHWIAKNQWISFLVMLLLQAGNDYAYQFMMNHFSSGIVDIYKYVVTYTVSYALISGFGILFHYCKTKHRIFFSIFFLGVTLLCGYQIGFMNLLHYKHPPMLYYAGYGLWISSLLYLLLDFFQTRPASSLVSWGSKVTMQIYLAHIVVYYGMDYMHAEWNPMTRMIVLLIGSCFIVWIYQQVVRLVKGR